MKYFFVFNLFVLFHLYSQAQNSFNSTWKTDNPGPSDDYTIHIPLAPESSYDFLVDWGDGITENFTGLGSELIVYHSYADIGTYIVSINGAFPRILFNENQDSRNKILSVDQWGDIEWLSFESAFSDCNNIQIFASDSPNLSQVTSMKKMFFAANSFNESINSWDVSNISDMSQMFELATAFNQPLNSWDVSNVTNMSRMFVTASSFNQAIDNWNVSNVTNMAQMFNNAHVFNQPINSWNVSNVTNMSSMFSNAGAFNQPIDQWDVSSVTNMSFMFSHIIADNSTFNQPINSWDVSSVTNMNSMFAFATMFNQPLSNWNVSNVTNMTWMFRSASSFNQPIASWNVSSATNILRMFWDAVNFNQPLNSWNVSNVTNMSYAFQDCQSFDQSLGEWDMTSAANVTGMLSNSNLSPCNYDETLIGWSQQVLQTNLQLGVQGLQHTQIGADAKQLIINNFGWSIFGDELIAIPELVVTSEVNGTEILIFASEGLGDYTYFWTGPNGFESTDSSIVAPQNGTYIVIVSDGCNQWSETFEILTVGISPSETDIFQLFPNPTTGLIYGFSNSSEYSKIQVFDLNGKQVFEADFTGYAISFDLSHLNSGIYFGRLLNYQGTVFATQRICVAR
jgi:surface protein